MGYWTVEWGTGRIASSFKPKYQKPFSPKTYLTGDMRRGTNNKSPVYGLRYRHFPIICLAWLTLTRENTTLREETLRRFMRAIHSVLFQHCVQSLCPTNSLPSCIAHNRSPSCYENHCLATASVVSLDVSYTTYHFRTGATSGVMGQWSTHLLRIREFPGWNLEQETCNSDLDVSCFS
jgi:hypothetical protein